MKLFGTSGIRRLADRELVELALQVGLAMGTIYKRVVVGRDSRTSGSAIYHAFTSGLLAAGAVGYDAGMAPTPTIAFIAREFEAGVMITASHNPAQYNGLKLLNPDGSAFSVEQQREVEEYIDKSKVKGQKSKVQVKNKNLYDEYPSISWERMLSDQDYTTAVEKHITRIMQDFGGGKKITVVLDCGCGAACAITPELLTRMGCEVVELNCKASGRFPHDVEPIEANLCDLMAKVKECGADLGIAHDGDADRMMAVDEKGRFISGDKMLGILARESQKSKVKGQKSKIQVKNQKLITGENSKFKTENSELKTGNCKIVTTIDASMAIEEMGFEVKRTKVGDPYVSQELKKGGCFGGEPSGAWVFPQISLCPDGIYGAARIVDIASRQKLSELVNSLPSHPTRRGSVNGKIAGMTALKEKLEAGLKPDSINTIDGLKLIFKDGWLLVRPSGTEPKIRVSAEGHDENAVRNYYNKGVTIIQDCLGEV